MLARRKLEYTDFSAGITENLVPGKMNAYARADNFLITRDKQLETRPGSKIYGDTLYQLPTGQQRVGAFFPFHNDTELFAQSGKEVYRASATWEGLTGPTGNSAFSTNTVNSRVMSAENRKKLYMVSDSGDGPQFIYPDENGDFQLRQAGLPRPEVAANYTDLTFLSAAITLALAVTAALIAHANSVASHVVAHSSVSAALGALTTPTTLGELITYVGVLKTQHNAHLADAQLNTTTGPRIYHANVQLAKNTTSTAGRYSVLNQQASTGLVTPTDLESVVATLNDIRTRYNFHTYSTITHINAIKSVSSGGAYANSVAGYGLNAVALPELSRNSQTLVGDERNVPDFSGQDAVVVAYVNQLKKEYNTHLASSSHSSADADNNIDISDATDIFSAYVLLAHLEFFYWCHYSDANGSPYISTYSAGYAFPGIDNGTSMETGGYSVFEYITGTSSTGSNTFTATSRSGSGLIGAVILFLGTPAVFAGFWAPDVNLFPARTLVTGGASGPNTIVFDHNYSSLIAGAMGYLFTNSRYHWSADLATGSKTTPTAYKTRVDNYPYTSLDLLTLASLADAFSAMLKEHEVSGWLVAEEDDVNLYYVPSTGHTTTHWATHTGNYQGFGPGTAWPEAAVVIDGITQTPADAVEYMDNPPNVGPVLYALVWRHDYTVETIDYLSESTPSDYFQVYWAPGPETAAPSTGAVYPLSLSNLPVLVNDPNENWDTSNIYLDIYRTGTNLQTFFKVGSVLNGVTTFEDSVTDDNLTSGQSLYTTGGVVANDEPPPSRFITMMNSTAYYGYVTDITSGEIFPNRVLQSIPGAPAAVPATFFDDLDDELSGLANFNSSVVAFCLSSLCRLEGTYNELGQNGMLHQEISKTMGCVSAQSIVTTEVGIFFCGTNGFAWTDGYTAKVVSTELDLTYASYIETSSQRIAITGVYDRLRRRVYWKFKSNPTTEECDLMWVLDLNWGVSEKMSFTTMSGGARFTPTALSFYQNRLIRGDALGYVFKYDPLYKNDPLIDPDEDATDWLEQPILWDFESCSTNFGSSQVKKWVTRITVQGKNRSDLSLQISHKNDNGKSGYSSLVPIRIRSNIRWGDHRARWGDVSCLWKYDGMIDDFRRFNAGTLRCDWKSVRMQNAYVIVDNSDSADTAGYSTEDA